MQNGNSNNNGNGFHPKPKAARNVLGGELQTCCTAPVTGFYRNGRCDTGREDAGVHAICAEVTSEFLEFSKRAGNDLSTPTPMHGFAGLKHGDKWCLCAARWREAFDAGFAPRVILEATHEAVLGYASLEDLQRHAIDNE